VSARDPLPDEVAQVAAEMALRVLAYRVTLKLIKNRELGL
jgi:hypothetical protein